MAILGKNRNINVSIDFVNLNKARLIYPYPLPQINDRVDTIVGFKRLSFLDASFEYNQIPLDEHDKMYTSFMTYKGLYWIFKANAYRGDNVNVHGRLWFP